MSKKNAREIIIDILQKIDQEGAYSNIALQQTLEKYSDLIIEDKRLITEITNGTIKYMKKIDYIINSFSKVRVNKMKPIIRYVMRMSVYQILFLDKIPHSATCNEAVNIVKKRKMGNLSGFVNGVLRNIIRNEHSIVYPDPSSKPSEYLSVMYSFPEWLITMWLKDYSFDFVEQLCAKMNESPDLTIRVNPLQISKEKLLVELQKEKIKVAEGQLVEEALHLQGVSSIASLPSFQKGYFTVQDESSMLATHVLHPQPGERIFDVCAAPGGKTTHMAERMKNQGMILSGDIYEHKLALIKENANRMGHTIVQPVLQDAANKNADYVNRFDRVLVDAPCSGFGIIRKKPDIRWKKEYSDIKQLVQIQRKIVQTCGDYVKPGGIMVYSTCTISKMENEQMVEWILQHLDFELESIDEYIPSFLHNESTKKGYIQIFPMDAITDGFFISRFRKRG